jgi:hypothetical protein
VRRWLKGNSLTIVMLGLFVGSFVGQLATGLHEHNDEAVEHGRAALDLAGYVTSGHFIEAVFENWESEFLQMGLFVVLTIFLRQRGSSESKKVDDSGEAVDEDPKKHIGEPRAPWPVRKGRFLGLYANSLSLSLFALFLVSFALHAVGGRNNVNEDQLAHGKPAMTLLEYVSSSRFWFESFQNWQSEFLSIAVLVVFSIYLRQKGSPQSKPVHAPHSETED